MTITCSISEIRTNPKAAKGLIALAIGQFSLMLRLARKPENIRLHTCNLVQATAIGAARERALDHFESGREIIRQLTGTLNGCWACEADLARREANILADLLYEKLSAARTEKDLQLRVKLNSEGQTLFRESLEKVHRSKDLYLANGDDGHDGRKNGLGACALVESLIYYYMDHLAEAIKIADRALRDHVKPTEQALSLALRYQKALALLGLNDADCHKEAKEITSRFCEEIGPVPSIPRLRVVWLDGCAAEKTGDEATAATQFEDALEDAESLQIPDAFAAILADAEALSPSPEALRGRLDRLRRGGPHDSKHGFPSWLRPTEELLVSVLSRSREDILGALSLLREGSGGNKMLPRTVYPLLLKPGPAPA